MKEEDQKIPTNDELNKKLSGLRAIYWICLVAAAFLLIFIIRDSLNGEELDTSLLIIAICSIGGGVSLSPQIKQIKEQLEGRSIN
jgi:hypothetical protein